MNRVSLLIGVALLMLAGCSSDSGQSTAGDATTAEAAPAEEGDAPFELSAEPVETNEVGAVKSYRFDPEVIQVSAGSEVTWSNEDDFPHNVHFLTGSDETHDLPIGEQASVTFDEAGDFYYECSIHPQQMRGLVTVTQ